MSELGILDEFTVQSRSVASEQAQEKTSEWAWYHVLPFAAIAIYMFAPILAWQFGLPSAIKFAGDMLVIVMIVLVVARMFTTDHIPGAFLIIIALSVIGAVVATFEGQNPSVTFLGWWMMFRYPMAALFVYMVPDWPRSIAAWLPKVLVWILGFQVIVQIGLYLVGVRDFDNLAGTFGRKGVGPFVFFILITLSFALGQWLTNGDWKLLFATLVLGSFASAMGEMKLFVIAAPLMAIIILGIHILRGGKVRQLIFYIIFFLIAGTAFYFAYERFIVVGVGAAPLEKFLESENRDRYLGHIRVINDSWQLGRNAEVEYGWQLIQKDNAALLFGYGLGTRQHSPELALVGEGVRKSLYGNYVGRSLLVLMFELGLVGLVTILGFIVFTVITLYRSANRDPSPELNVLRYGMLLFTMLWPLWIWYKPIWSLTAPTLIYWVILGYVMRYSFGDTFGPDPADPSSTPQPSNQIQSGEEQRPS